MTRTHRATRSDYEVVEHRNFWEVRCLGRRGQLYNTGAAARESIKQRIKSGVVIR